MSDRSRLEGSARVFAALLLGIAGASCSTPKLGQSGSEELPTPPNGGGGSTVPCPCMSQFGDRVIGLRVTLQEQRGAVVRLRVEETLVGTSSIEPGDVIEGQSFDDTFACYVGCREIEVGEQAFAFFFPHADDEARPECAARSSCVETCQRAHAPERDADETEETFGCACRDQTAALDHRFSSPTCGGRIGDFTRTCQSECEASEDACTSGADIAAIGSVKLSPWSDPLVFARHEDGREIRVPVSEVSQLWPAADETSATAFARCSARFGDWAELLDNGAGL